MTNRPGDPRFYRLLDEIANLHARKSQDYSPASDPLKNFRSAADVGVRPYAGVLTRLGDKWGRIATFARSGQLQNESARDSHIDSAVYHLIAVLLLEDEANGAPTAPAIRWIFDADEDTAVKAVPSTLTVDSLPTCTTVAVAGSDEPVTLPAKVYVGEDGNPDYEPPHYPV